MFESSVLCLKVNCHTHEIALLGYFGNLLLNIQQFVWAISCIHLWDMHWDTEITSHLIFFWIFLIAWSSLLWYVNELNGHLFNLHNCQSAPVLYSYLIMKVTIHLQLTEMFIHFLLLGSLFWSLTSLEYNNSCALSIFWDSCSTYQILSWNRIM